jgi:nifR3 family TIM-barrel protein
MKNFWDALPKPFFALAPLANVTDAVFRRLIATYSKPYGPAVMYTEFVSADGLALAPKKGRDKLMRDLSFSEAERPIVAQFFTSNLEYMEKAAALAQSLDFDGVDINMGCPDKSIEKQGAGAKLMQNSLRAQELIAAARRGAPNLPVSVKTRLGYNKDILEEWLRALLQAEPAAIAIHARTRKEMSRVPAHWDRIKRAVEIRNEMKSSTLIIGNGDVLDLDDAKKKAQESGAEGIMLGRAIFGRPWLFAKSKLSQKIVWPDCSVSSRTGDPRTFSGEVTTKLRLRVAIEHTKLFEELLGDIKSFAIMKKHFKAYAEGFPGAKELRMELMETKNAQEVEEVIEKYLSGILVSHEEI